MKTLRTIVLPIILLAALSSCQSPSTQVYDLSNKEARNEIMHEIANDTMMSNEMIVAMTGNRNGMMMLRQHQMMTFGNQNSMMDMMKNNPAMMRSMMSTMMETAKGDTIMISGMIEAISENPQMMEMMQNRMGNNRMNSAGHNRRMDN